jgi:hypothetical protein
MTAVFIIVAIAAGFAVREYRDRGNEPMTILFAFVDVGCWLAAMGRTIATAARMGS